VGCTACTGVQSIQENIVYTTVIKFCDQRNFPQNIFVWLCLKLSTSSGFFIMWTICILKYMKNWKAKERETFSVMLITWKLCQHTNHKLHTLYKQRHKKNHALTPKSCKLLIKHNWWETEQIHDISYGRRKNKDDIKCIT
jgi:hypothetical protein